MDTVTFFLVDDGRAMPRWCRLVPAKDGGLAWMDAKARTWTQDAARPLAHVEGRTIECTLDDVSGEVAGMVRDFAERRLLDPWSDQGWLSPEGRFYGCAYYAHDDIAHGLLGKRVGELELAGFVRVHADVFLTSSLSSHRGPTPRQARVLERLGFDVETRRRMPYEADRALPPPGFAVKPRFSHVPAAPEPLPEIPVDAGNLLPFLERLRASEALGFLFETEEPELVTELGGGNWDWLLHFPGGCVDVGTGETLRDLLEAPGLYLHAPAPDQVEVYAWHRPGVEASDVAREALDRAVRYAPRR